MPIDSPMDFLNEGKRRSRVEGIVTERQNRRKR